MCFSTLSNSKACNPNCFLLESRLNDLFFFFGDLLLLELVAEDEEAEEEEEEEEAADAAELVAEEAEEEEEDEVPGAVVPAAVPGTVSLAGAEAASNDNGMSSSRMDGAAGRAMCGWSVRWPLPCFLCFPCCFPCFFARLWAPPPRDEEDEEEDEAEEEDVVVEEEKEEAPFNCRRLGLM